MSGLEVVGIVAGIVSAYAGAAVIYQIGERKGGNARRSSRISSSNRSCLRVDHRYSRYTIKTFDVWGRYSLAEMVRFPLR